MSTGLKRPSKSTNNITIMHKSASVEHVLASKSALSDIEKFTNFFF